MKICFLADANSIHTRKWVDYFSKYDCEIYLISMNDTEYVYGKNVHKYIIKPNHKSKLTYFFIAFKISKLIKKIKPDILHSHYATSYGLFGRIANYKPFVISTWGSDINDFPNHSFLHKMLIKYILKGADIICATSESIAQQTEKFCNKEIVITPFGVDVKLFTNKVPILGNETITIGVVKNLEKIYGIDILLRSFAKLCSEVQNEDLRLMIVGDGSQKNELLRLCRKLNISDKVTFTGYLDNNKVPCYINKMDIVCIPSLSEGFGVCAVEACACGRPIVASKAGGLKEIIINEYNGYLTEISDVVDLKNKLKLIINDKNKLRKFSQNARNLAINKYDWNENAKEMVSVYDRLVSSYGIKNKSLVLRQESGKFAG